MKKLVLLIATLLSFTAIAKDNAIVLTPNNTISLLGKVDYKSVSGVIQKMYTLSAEKFYLYISSPGGRILAGQSLIGAMKASGKDIECIADFAASMAFVIFQKCKVRHILPHSIIMQHEASYGVNGQAPNIKSMVGFIERMLFVMDTEQAKRLQISYKIFKQKTRDDWWIYGPDILKAKAADNFATVKCSKRLTKSWYKRIFGSFFSSAEKTIYFSKCPLILAPIDKPKNADDDDVEYQYITEYDNIDVRTMNGKMIKEINNIKL